MNLSRVDYLWIIVMLWLTVWTLILTAPIHCRGSIGEQESNANFLQIYFDQETNSSTSWMAGGWVHFQQIFICGWSIPLTKIVW